MARNLNHCIPFFPHKKQSGKGILKKNEPVDWLLENYWFKLPSEYLNGLTLKCYSWPLAVKSVSKYQEWVKTSHHVHPKPTVVSSPCQPSSTSQMVQRNPTTQPCAHNCTKWRWNRAPTQPMPPRWRGNGVLHCVPRWRAVGRRRSRRDLATRGLKK